MRSTVRFEGVAFGQEWFQDLRLKFDKLEDQLGYKEKDYAEWLVKKRRQHSTTALFEFTDEM
jgi:hypothetical protein